tara:strand:- start:215 stop:967 length:753 start_codon:yes stop_codon:yes gene_type:complete
VFGISLELIAIISAAICLGGFVKGVTGIGLPIVTIAVLTNILEPLTTFAILVAPILVTNLWQAITAKNWKGPFCRFPLMILMLVICLFIGVQLAIGLKREVLILVLGVSVTIFSASTLIKPLKHPLSRSNERWLGPLAGAVGGILGGLTTIWGPPMLMFLILLKLDKETWVQTVGVIWFIGSIPLAIAYWKVGILNAETAPISLLACIPGMVGIWLGEAIRHRINSNTFKNILLATLLLIGLNLIRRGVF